MAQLALGTPALLDFASELEIERLGVAARLAQPLDQPAVLQALLEPVAEQPADLPGDEAEGSQDDQRQDAQPRSSGTSLALRARPAGSRQGTAKLKKAGS